MIWILMQLESKQNCTGNCWIIIIWKALIKYINWGKICLVLEEECRLLNKELAQMPNLIPSSKKIQQKPSPQQKTLHKMLKQLFSQEIKKKKMKYLIKCQFLKGLRTNRSLETSKFNVRSQWWGELERRFITRVNLNYVFSHKDL